MDNAGTGIMEEAILNANRINADVLAVDILMVLNFLGNPQTRETVTFRDILIPAFEIKKKQIGIESGSKTLFLEI